MRELESAIWTSGEPVSFSARRCSAISLPLTSVSVAKPSSNYTEPTFGPVYPDLATEPSDLGSAAARHTVGPSITIACAWPKLWCFGGISSTWRPERLSSPAPG